MSKLPARNSISGKLWRLDAIVSSAIFESWDWLKRFASAYSAFLYRFRLRGLKRIVIDLVDDGVTFGVLFCFGLLAYALPPFSGTGDVWNRGREYAVTFTDANGEIIGRRGIRQDDAIPLSEIPPQLVKAALATEDARFFEHFGVDVIGTLRAIVQNARANDVVQGGSSITQQVAKNLFLSPERTIRRKVHEAFLSLWIEARLTKEEILKLYLDRSYLGGGNYGVEAASQFYFGKSVRDINLSEAAMLAGLFKAPSKYAPHQNIEAAKARANTVLYRMLDAGFITQGELLQSRRQPASVVTQSTADSPDWFLDWAYRDTLALLDEKKIGGAYVLEVKTTIDMPLQVAAQQAINDELAASSEKYHVSQGAVVTMTPQGAVRAIVGGSDYEVSQFNRATDALRQSGSAFKPFVYLAALLHGYKPNQTVVDGPVSIGGWSPRNYSGKYAGRTTLTTALARSYNSVPVKLMIDIGRKAIIDTAHLAGIQGELENWAPMVLGTSALSLLDLTTGYATFAGGGRRAKPFAVLEIRKANGDLLYSRGSGEAPPRQAVPEEKIAELNSMLAAVVKSGTGRRADLGYAPQGGKTGTNQSYRDAWFIGFTAHNVTGVWYGNDDFTPMNRVTGGLLPAGTWKRVMDVAERGQTPEGLAGIPYDNSYAVAAVPADRTTAQLSPVADEVDQNDIDTIPAVDAPDDVSQVLNGMFNLFEDNNRTVQVKRKKPSQEALILPKANTQSEDLDTRTTAGRKRSFFEKIFGSVDEPKPKKQRKKKTLLDLY
ncbi:MAG: PBP1A family penicillin-binding protein [Alphaproteobacteria bacterium]|nr:PBP1A family penicillin-binding protein [Alphaproteobacteria bacterium]